MSPPCPEEDNADVRILRTATQIAKWIYVEREDASGWHCIQCLWSLFFEALGEYAQRAAGSFILPSLHL